MITELMKQMAIAALSGDETAACGLADLMCENGMFTRQLIVPVKVLTCRKERLHAVFFTNPVLGGDVAVDSRDILDMWDRWSPRMPMMLRGMQMELYELPPSKRLT